MRVIAGQLGGRLFQSPHSHRTHPMSDKVRGALFNMLGNINGLTVLDAFAGSGALGFEAVSRGAAQVTALEIDKAAQKTIVQNIAALHVGARITLVKANAGAWLRTAHGKTYDIVLCDPPYDDLQPSLLMRLTACVAPDGLLVVSWPGDTEPPLFDGFRVADQRGYGDIQLVFYRRFR